MPEKPQRLHHTFMASSMTGAEGPIRVPGRKKGAPAAAKKCPYDGLPLRKTRRGLACPTHGPVRVPEPTETQPVTGDGEAVSGKDDPE